MATNRLTPEEIRSAVAEGTHKEGWDDLFSDVRIRHSGSGYQPSIDYHMVAASHLLDRLFPGRNWGWQDFDKMLSETYQGKWESVHAWAEYRQSIDRAHFVQGADEPTDPYLYVQPELGPEGTKHTHIVQYPAGGMIFVFGPIKNSHDVLR